MKSYSINIRIILAVLWVWLFISPARSQMPQPAALNKKIDHFAVQSKSAAEALDLLSERSGIRFSYKTDILPSGKMYDLSEEKKTVGQLLYLLFKDDYEYEEQAGYIIVQLRHSYFVLSGFVVDAVSHQPVEKAMVATLAGAFQAETDARGYFELKIPVQHKVDYIAARKDFYSDGFMEIRTATDKKLFISLQAMKTVELQSVTTSNTPENKNSGIALSPLGTKRRGTTRLAIGGLFNNNPGNARNLQLAGVVNIIRGSLYGVQLAGVHNLVMDTTKGVQIASLINRSEGMVKGVQIAAVNRAKKLKGLQIGVVNIADSSAGYSLGLINIVKSKNGYRRLSLYATDLTNTNLSLKLGNSNLYSVILAGANLSGDHRLYSVGWGLGHDFIINQYLSVSAEGNYQFVDAGSWDNRLVQFRSSLNIQLFKGMALFAGPVYNYYKDNQGYRTARYKEVIPYTGTALFERRSKSWMGWQVGLTSIDLAGEGKKQDLSKNAGQWSLQAGVSPGVDIKGSLLLAADILVQREFREGIAARASAAMNNRMGQYSSDPQYNFKLGVRIMAQKGFYVAGDVGYGQHEVTEINSSSFPLYHTYTKFSFMWSPSFGWKLGERFDVSARYENLGSPFFLRLGYAVWRSKVVGK